MRRLIVAMDQVGVWIALGCGLATVAAGAVSLAAGAPDALAGHLVGWLIGLPEIGAGLICTLWSRQQLVR